MRIVDRICSVDADETVTSVFDRVSPGVFFGGFKVATIPVIYGIIIYIVSRIPQTPCVGFVSEVAN